MKRMRYGLNAITTNAGEFNRMIPLGYLETVPGETYSGSLKIDIMSDTTNSVLFNRAFFDILVVYSPFRILDETFPDFLINGTGSIPTVTDLWKYNFEKAYNLPSAATGTSNTAWQRYMYNATWNRFVRRANETEAALTDNDRQKVSLRPSTWHESVPEADSTTPETIDTSGSTLSVDAIREALQADRFNKTRQYYGDRYVDYLSAVGVQADWSILEEPQLLATSRNTLKYQIVNVTTADATTPEAPVGS